MNYLEDKQVLKKTETTQLTWQIRPISWSLKYKLYFFLLSDVHFKYI